MKASGKPSMLTRVASCQRHFVTTRRSGSHGRFLERSSNVELSLGCLDTYSFTSRTFKHHFEGDGFSTLK